MLQREADAISSRLKPSVIQTRRPSALQRIKSGQLPGATHGNANMTACGASGDEQQSSAGIALTGAADWSAWPDPSATGKAASFSKK